MWTLKNSRTGEENSFDGWGIESPQIQHVSFDIGRLTAVMPDFATADLPFQHRDKLIIYRDREYDEHTETFSGGVVHYVATYQVPTSDLHETDEGAELDATDPWWFLEKIRFERTFKVFGGWVGGIVGGTMILNDETTTNVVLNQGNDGNYINTRDELANILDLAIARGAPIQYVKAELPSQQIPPRSELDISCADAIRRQAAYMNAVQWWDYSTAPYPKFCMKRRADCIPVDLAVTPPTGTPQSITVGRITRRDDLVVPYVRLNFEKEYTDTGGSFLQITTYQYPVGTPTDHIGPLLATIRLAPKVGMTLTQEIETRTLDATDINFWKAFKPELSTDLEYHGLAIIAGSTSVTGALGLPRALVKGELQPWMAVNAEEVVVTAKVKYTQRQTVGGLPLDVNDVVEQTITARVVSTDAVTDVYTKTITQAYGENPASFASLAQQIFTDLNTPTFDGTITITDNEVPINAGIGNTINITGGRAEWATMLALVQNVTEDLENASRQLTIGVNKTLSADQIIELMRMNRTRTLSLSVDARSQAGLNMPQVDLGSDAPLNNPNTSQPVMSKASAVINQSSLLWTARSFVAPGGTPSPTLACEVIKPDGTRDTAKGSIEASLSRTFGTDIKIRELHGLDSGKYALALISATYASQKIGGETPIELASGGGSSVVKMVITSVHTDGSGDVDYVVCDQYNAGGGVAASGVQVAIPHDLRPAAKPASYMSIKPAYTAGSTLEATEPVGGTGDGARTWIDLNIAARKWHTQIAVCISGTNTNLWFATQG